MGMYNGVFNVVDGGQTGPLTTNTSAPACGGSGGSGCSCGAKTVAAPAITGQVVTQGLVQVLQATCSSTKDIQPNQFTVRANQPVRFEIAAQDNGQGCMGSVTIPSLTSKVEVFTKGQTTVFEFTPTKTGAYNITCAMGIPRGQIQVN